MQMPKEIQPPITNALSKTRIQRILKSSCMWGNKYPKPTETVAEPTSKKRVEWSVQGEEEDTDDIMLSWESQENQ